MGILTEGLIDIYKNYFDRPRKELLTRLTLALIGISVSLGLVVLAGIKHGFNGFVYWGMTVEISFWFFIYPVLVYVSETMRAYFENQASH